MPIWLTPTRHRHGGTREDIVLAEQFQCPECEHVSYNANDVREGYCGHCHWWTGDGLLYELWQVERAATTVQLGR